MASFYRVYPLKRPSIGLSKAYDATLASVTIRLPPSIGLGLDRAAQFLALGFREATFHVAVPKLSKQAVFGSSVTGDMSVFTSSTAVSIKDKGQMLIPKAMKEARQNIVAAMFIMDPMVIVMPPKFFVTSFLQDFPMAYPKVWPYTEMLLEELIQIVAKYLGLKGCKFYPNEFIQFVQHDKRINVVLKENKLDDCSIPIESTYTIEFGSKEFASDWGFISTTIVINSIYEHKSTGLLDIDFLYTADEEDEFDQYLKYTIAAQIFELKNQLVGHIAALIWRAYKSKAESGSDLSAVGSDNLTNESETTTESVVEKSTKKLQKRFELLKKLSMSQKILATKITCLQVHHQSLANLRPKTSTRTKTMTTTATAVKLVTSKNESLSLFSKS